MEFLRNTEPPMFGARDRSDVSEPRGASPWAWLGFAVSLAIVAQALPASAQQRTPTSPMDRGPIAPPTRVAPPPPAASPNTPARPTPRTAVPLRIPAGAANVGLEDLIPELTSGALDEGTAVTRALELGITAQQAQLAEDAALASLRVARRAFTPHIEASFRYTRLSDYTPGTISTFNTPGCLADLAACQASPNDYYVDAVLQEPILDQFAANLQVSSRLSDLIGARRHQLRAARANLEASAANAELSRLQAAETAISAYWELVRARAQLTLAQQARDVAATRAGEAAQRRAAGVSTDADAIAAVAGATAYDQVVAAAEIRAEYAEAYLRDLLRWPAEETLGVEGDLLPLPELPAQLDSLAAEAQERSPQLAAARAQADAADAQADAQRAGQMPTLDVAFNLDSANPNSRIFPQETVFTTTWDLTVQVGWSLDGALIAGAQRQQQRANAESARLAAQDASEALARQVLQARGNLAAALVAVEAQRLAAAGARERDRVAAARAEAGVSTMSDREASASDYLGARLDLVDAIVEAHLAHARLRRVLGTDPQQLTQR